MLPYKLLLESLLYNEGVIGDEIYSYSLFAFNRSLSSVQDSKGNGSYGVRTNKILADTQRTVNTLSTAKGKCKRDLKA